MTAATSKANPAWHMYVPKSVTLTRAVWVLLLPS